MRRLFFLSAFSWLAAASATAQLIQTEANFAVIMDAGSGEILFEKNGETPMVPASMTKVMTAYLVFERLRSGEISLDDRLPVSENAWRRGGWSSGGSTMGLSIGETPTIRDLMRGVIVLSGNDACIVLAEGLSGSEELFAAEMTEAAQRMGLTTASFKNVSGLFDEGHVISAADMARLAKATITEFPEYYDFYAEPEMTWNGITQANRNPILGKMEGVDGLKTGHLSVSGYGLVASALRGDERRIIVINGLSSVAARRQEADRLMRTAFDAFETRTIEADGTILADLDVWLGEDASVGVALGDPLSVTAHKRAFVSAVSEIVYSGPLEAPITKGDQVAELVITLDDKGSVRVPLVATRDVEKLGFIGRAVEGLSRRLEADS
ncbi:MAG: D-alanyl-D-alanine carboxypeptidase family protein [Pseudomonadota bacterium]